MTRRQVHPKHEWRLSLSLVNSETGRICGSHPLTFEVALALLGRRYQMNKKLLNLCFGEPDTPEALLAIGYPEYLIDELEEELAHQAQERAAATNEHTGVAGVLEEI